MKNGCDLGKLSELRAVARDVRKRCVRFAMSDASRDMDFHGARDLECGCLFASTILAYQLRRLKIDTQAKVAIGYYGDNEFDSHAWVIALDHVVDITVSQFSNFVDRLRDIEIVPIEAAKDWHAEVSGAPGQVGKDWECHQRFDRNRHAEFITGV